MSLAQLFYLKETFRERVRQWRLACFASEARRSSFVKRISFSDSAPSRQTLHASRFTLEALEPRVLLSASPTDVSVSQPIEPAAVSVPQGTLASLDVDLNGQADALTDGILLMRHLFGFTGTALTNGAVDPAGQRTDPTAITNYLESIRPSLDVDLNQTADALSDGIVIIRSLFGFTGTALTDGAIDPGGGRTDPAVIATFLDNMNPQRELVAPIVTAGLQQDTGLSTSDAITFNPTITGTLADISQISSFTAGFDATPLANFTTILGNLLPTGAFTLSTARMNQIAGGTLADGTHTLHLRATDARGNVATLDRTFTLDTTAPLSPTFDLAVTSDTGTLGDQQTTAAIVTLKGQTDPTSTIQLLGPGTSTLSNGTGTFQLPDLALAVGANAFTLRASDVAGNQSEFSRTITRLAAAQQADVVLIWNQVMLDAIQRDATAPPIASRGLAMVSLAMYDTINAIEGTPGYYVSLPAVLGTDPTAAAASAAHRVLSYLYPGQQAFLDAQLAASLAGVPDGPSKTNGIALGQNIADAIIAIRATDGWNDFVDYIPGNQPGDWQPTAPMYDLALLPQWADLTPFALTSPDQFAPAGPPALDSAAYAAAFNEVKALGSATGSTRTAEQTEIARFWADGAGTSTPPGHWNAIAEQIALQQGNSLSANARLFAQLNVALADAGITAWNTKYAHDFWRPITAIQQADLDGNANTAKDANWSSLLITPPFPEYVSGHSTYSGAAAEILTGTFGANVAFSTTSLGLPNVTRNFTSFEQAAQEAGRSRIYGGIHFEFSNQDGLTAGKSLADFVLNRFTVTTDTQAPKILLNQQTGIVTKTNLTLTGQVLDNLSGVATLQAKLDNGTFAPVTVDATGHFTLTTTLALNGTADGLHQLTFQATDLSNNLSTLTFTFTLDTQAPTITLTSPTENATLTVASRLTGIADATGSKLVELCYKFDNGVLVPVSFDSTTGSFDISLDLSKLAVGNHTLSLRAQDQAGNITTVTKNVTLAAPIPLTIIEVTPQAGASDVGSTFRPQVFFSRPVNPGTLNSNNFYATDTTGTKLPATIVPSQDGTFAWLFLTNPMPGASTITLHVDGTTILAAGDGQALDADSNGTPGGVFTSTFSTVSLVPLLGTTLSGKVLDPGPDLRMGTFDDIRAGADGILHTDDDVFLNPIAGATVYILGLESQAVVTDAQGNFSFNAVPSGTIKLAIDGRTATNAPAGFFFPEMVMDLDIDVGQANTVMGTMGTREEKAANLTRPEVYLPRLQTSILQTVSNTQDTMIGVDANAAPNLTAGQRQFLTLEVQPGSLIGPDGQPLTNGQLGISTVPPELVRDMLPPGVLQHTFDITIQAPDAATFNTPLQMTFPNVFNAAPGTQLNFLSFDHTTGRLVIEGTATVSADGLSVITDPGTGITKPGWHGLTPPGNTNDNDVREPKLTNSSATVATAADAFDVMKDVVRLSAPVAAGVIGGIAGASAAIVPGGQLLGVEGAIAGFNLAFTIVESVASKVSVIADSIKGAGRAIAQGVLQGKSYADIASDVGQAWVSVVAQKAAASINPYLSYANGWREAIDHARSLGTNLGKIVGPPGVDPDMTDVYLQLASNYGWATPTQLEIDDFNLFYGQLPAGNDVLPGVFVSLQNVATEAAKITSLLRVSSPTADTITEINNSITRLESYDSLILNYTAASRDSIRQIMGEVNSALTERSRLVTGSNKMYYMYDTGGLQIRGQANGGKISAFLPANSTIEAHVYDVGSDRVGGIIFVTGASGEIKSQGPLILAKSSAADTDGDGLPDDAEAVIGTSPSSADTNNNGITDFVELKQGLDPLGGSAFSNGVISSLPLLGEAKEVSLEGSVRVFGQQTVYVATGSFGLAIIDASQFQKPSILRQLDLPGDATDVAVDSQLGIAVVASNAGGLHFINVSNPTAPTLIRTIATTPNQVEVSDGFAYVTVGGELRSYNILTGDLVQAASLSSGSLVGLAREGDTLYTTDNVSVLRATSVIAGALTPRGSLTIALPFGQSTGKIFVGNGIAYIGVEGNFAGGFATANVANPDSPVLLSGVDANNIAGKAIVANGSGLGVSVGRPGGAFGTNVLDVVILTDPTNTNNFLTRFTLPAEPFSVAIGAGIAFVADGTGGLQVVNYRSFDNLGVAPTVSITSPIIDLDPVTPGIQVTEGSSIPIRVTATDDVQVRNVEMLVNGVVVSNDVSFPFELSAIALGGTPSATTTTVQVRATDTGGNVALSNTLTFQLVPDTFPPTLVSSNLTNGAIKDKTFRTVQLLFSEPLDPTKVTAQNFQVLGPNGTAVAPTAIQSLTGGSVVQLTYNPLDLGTNQLVIKSANVTDRVGNPLGTQDVVIPFQVVSHAVPALNPLPPLGSRMYVQRLLGQIDAPFASESFTIVLDGGQTVTVGLSPDTASLRPRIELLDSTGTVLGAAESSEIGAGVTLQVAPVPTTGVYTVRVQSLSGTGSFGGALYLNALEEEEFFGGPTNDTLAMATDLSPTSLPLQGSADRMAVIGAASGGDDFYRVDLTQGQGLEAMLQAFGEGDIGLDLRNSAGTVLTIGRSDLPNGISRGILDFVAPTTGVYYLNVTGLPGPDPLTGIPQYSLVVTRGSALEVFPNDDLTTPEDMGATRQILGSVGARVFPQIGLTIPDPADFYSFHANAGDVLQITTATSGDGPGEPVNTLDPALELYGPSGALVASNLNGAADGRNAVISATAATTGQYKIAVIPTAGAGDYVVRVVGATGQQVSTFSVISSSLASNPSQASLELQFSTPVLLSSVAASDVTINGVAASSYSVVDAQTLRFTATGVTPVGGGYTVVLAAGAVQDLRGTVNTAFSRLFTGDTTGPVVTSSSITALTVLQPSLPGTITPLTVTFTFSEPIDQTTLSENDVQLRFGIASDGFDSVALNAASVAYDSILRELTVQFFTGLPTRSQFMTLTLVGGPTGIHDLAGNPLNGSPNFPLPSGQGNPAPDNYVVEFGVAGSTPSFAPLTSDAPFGSLLYFPDQDLVSTFAVPGETDVWTIGLKAGQTMGTAFVPTSGIQGKLTVLDPNGTILGTVSSAATGRSVAIAGIPIATTGTYRIEVTSLAGIGAYRIGLGLNSSFDVDLPELSAGTNNTVSKAQNIEVSAIPLQGTASRLAVQGSLSSTFDPDLYSFQVTAGQPTTLVLKNLDFTAPPVFELLKSDGSLLATGVLSADGTVRISDHIPLQSATYLARIASVDGSPYYNLVITRGAAFEQQGNDAIPQNIAVSGQVLGGLEKQGQGVNGAIRVAVLGGVGAVPLVAQLNDDTFYDFDAVAVTDSDIDRYQELIAYDVVVIGDPTSGAMLQGPVEEALTNWWINGGGGLVGTGGLITAADPGGGVTLFALDNVIPINLNAASTITGNLLLTVGSTPHEVTQGISTFTVNGNVELPAGTVDQGAVVLGTVNGSPAVVARDLSSRGDGSRSAYVGPMYFDTTATGLRSGTADRLLEQTIAWASHVNTSDSYRIGANAGDQLVIKTTTPFDGPNLPQNLLDPRIELLNPAGTIVASNDNGAADGKNALINYIVPVGGAGTYTIRVMGLGVGEYTLSATGATGSVTVTTAATPTATTSSAVVTDSITSTAVMTTMTESTTDLSLAYVQYSWVADFVGATTNVMDDDEEELLIALPG